MKGKKIVVSFIMSMMLLTFAACGTGTSGYNKLTPKNVEAPRNMDGNTNYNAPGSNSPGSYNNTNDADRNVVRDGTRNNLDNINNNDNIYNP